MFKERLRERMKQKGLSTKEIAKQLYNFGSNSNLWENCEKQKNKTRKIQKWLDGTDMPKSINDLEKLCTILDCDFAYLMGDTPISSLNNKKVADWLGIDEVVVSKIKNYEKDIKLFMSLLIRANEYDEKMEDILHEFLEKMLFLSQNSSHTIVTIEDDISGEKENLKGEAAFNYILPAIKSMVEPIFYEVALLGIGINSKRYDVELEKRETERKKEMEDLLNNITKITGKSKEEVIKEFESQREKG